MLCSLLLAQDLAAVPAVAVDRTVADDALLRRAEDDFQAVGDDWSENERGMMVRKQVGS